jgi:F-type H+-transporting ATPase subunit b
MIAIGGAIAAGGFMVSEQVKNSEFIKNLANQGIPLDPGKTVAMIGVLIAMFSLIDLFFFRPLKGAIDSRNSELESTFSEAESLRSEMGSLKSEYEARIAVTEANAREQIQAQIREAQAFRDQLKSEASAQAEEYKKRAMSEIDAEKSGVINDLRLHVVNLTMQATEKVVGENMDTERNRKLVEEFIDKMEVPV